VVPGTGQPVYSNPGAYVGATFNRLLQDAAAVNPELVNDPWFKREFGKYQGHYNQQLMIQAIREQSDAFSQATKNQAYAELGTLFGSQLKTAAPNYEMLNAAVTERVYKAGIKDPHAFVASVVEAGYQEAQTTGGAQVAKDYLTHAGEIQIGNVKLKDGVFKSDYYKLLGNAFEQDERQTAKEARLGEAAKKKELETFQSDQLYRAVASATPEDGAEYIEANKASLLQQPFGSDKLNMLRAEWKRAAEISDESNKTNYSAFLEKYYAGNLTEAEALATTSLRGLERVKALELMRNREAAIAQWKENSNVYKQVTAPSRRAIREFREDERPANDAIADELEADFEATDDAYTKMIEAAPTKAEKDVVMRGEGRKLWQEHGKRVQAARQADELNKTSRLKLINDNVDKDNTALIKNWQENGVIGEQEAQKLIQTNHVNKLPRERLTALNSQAWRDSENIYRSILMSKEINVLQPNGKLVGPAVDAKYVYDKPKSNGSVTQDAFPNPNAIQLTPEGEQFLNQELPLQVLNAFDTGWMQDPKNIALQKSDPEKFYRAGLVEINNLTKQVGKWLKKGDYSEPFNPYAKKAEGAATKPSGASGSESKATDTKPAKETVKAEGSASKRVPEIDTTNSRLAAGMMTGFADKLPRAEVDLDGSAYTWNKNKINGREDWSPLKIAFDKDDPKGDVWGVDTMAKIDFENAMSVGKARKISAMTPILPKDTILDIFTDPVKQNYHPYPLSIFALQQVAQGKPGAMEFVRAAQKNIDRTFMTVQASMATDYDKSLAYINANKLLGISYKDIIEGYFSIGPSEAGRKIKITNPEFIPYELTPLFPSIDKMYQVLENDQEARALFDALGIQTAPNSAIIDQAEYFISAQQEAIRRRGEFK